MEEKKAATPTTGKLPYEKAEMQVIEIANEQFIVASDYEYTSNDIQGDANEG